MSNRQVEYELYVEYALQKWLIEEKGYTEYDAKIKVMQDFEEVKKDFEEYEKCIIDTQAKK